ncbi:hypothetical protein ACFL0V_00495 [Nanoarchaeota archaeon]
MPFIYESKNFRIEAPEKCHVSRADGGHLIIRPKKETERRRNFSPKKATELMRLSMIFGEALDKGLNKRGIKVERINFQDNGNWRIGTRKHPHAHLHLYGRAKNSKNQKHGEALYFPDKKTKFWLRLKPLNQEDIEVILKEVKKIENRKKYDLRAWGLS